MLNTQANPAVPAGPKPPAGPANPFAPKGPAADDTPAAPSAAPAPSGMPAPPPFAAPPPPSAAPPPPAGPAAPAGPPGLNLGGDLFKKKEPTVATAAAPQARAAAPQVDAAAFFETPSRQVLDEAPAPEAEFANPLQVGSFGYAAAPVDLNAEEEAALSSFEHKQRGIKPSLAIGMTVGIALLTLFFGFFIGDARVSRQLINAQIEASIRVKDRVQETIDVYNRMKLVAASMDENAVDWDKVKQIPAELPDVDAGILSSPVPLDRDLTSLLTRYLVETSAFFAALEEHRQLTMGRDKAELEAMADGSSFTQHPAFAVLYDPVPADARGPYIPPVGVVVAVTGKPREVEVEENRKTVIDYVLPIINRQGKESEVSLRRILRVEKSEFITAGKATPMTLYQDRVKDLKTRVKSIETYQDALIQALKAQAEREKVFSI
ncbi:MAG: hypothetical protein H6703_14970 [Myxococcales bacterium]|nr:hypothetical protein [Myxococcales bacterium]